MPFQDPKNTFLKDVNLEYQIVALVRPGKAEKKKDSHGETFRLLKMKALIMTNTEPALYWEPGMLYNGFANRVPENKAWR
jgi:hypothetical protein